MQLPIYMDNQSTTPVDPRVLDAMLPFFKEEFGNAASRSHVFGLRAEAFVQKARAEIASLIRAEDPDEIIFTSGATESNNLAIKGLAFMFHEKGNHVITSAIEHKSVMDSCKFLETRGFKVTYLPVNHEGLIDPNDLRKAIHPKTILISIMHANNEIGAIQNVSEIGTVARESGVFFHSDLAQSIGKIPVDVQAMHLDLASLSAHKIYGPKGIGALYVRKKNPRVRLEPLIHGGGHERTLRSGTLNVPAIVGLGTACEILVREMGQESQRILKLRERLRNGIMSRLEGVHLNGSLERRLPGNLNLSFDFLEGETLLSKIATKIAVSSGSACTSAAAEPSYVLKALGFEEGRIHTSIRFGLGRFNTEKEIDDAIKHVVEIVNKLRSRSPIFKTPREAKETSVS